MTKTAGSIFLGLLFASSAAASDLDLSARFAFATPNETTVEEALRQAGKPYSDYKTSAIEGEVDLLVQSPTLSNIGNASQRARKHNKQVITVRVLEYRDRDNSSRVVRLVFSGEKLWYALIPLSGSESKLANIEAHHSRKPFQCTESRRIVDLVYTLKVRAYPGDGVAYVQKGGEEFGSKVIFPPARKHPFGPECRE